MQYRAIDAQPDAQPDTQLDAGPDVEPRTALIDCPAATATAATIPSGYFVPAVSTVLDLYRC